jgi:aspartyl-tRNA(Asn)/glutamyl-tRNA(Gln) amidotransferase subunit C
MKITRDDVLHVAELAHLELSEAEVEMYRGQLDSILTYIEKLNQLDTSEVEPLAQVLAAISAENPSLREDAPQSCGMADALFEVAPDPNRPYFRVPKVIER